MTGLPVLIDSLKLYADEEGNWAVPTDDLIGLLALDTAAFFQTLYAIRDKIFFSDAIDSFHNGNAGDLVTLLEQYYGDSAEAALSTSGLYLPQVFRIELMDCFLSHAHDFLMNHSIRFPDFHSMLAATRSFDRAVGLYFQEYVSIDAIMAGAVSIFAEIKGYDAIGSRTSMCYLAELFTRHILTRNGIFSSLTEQLMDYARSHNFFPKSERKKVGVEKKIQSAREIMGLDGVHLTTSELKNRYKALIKLYHPDVNPDGLERCKDINNAYAFLLSYTGLA